MSEKTGHTHGHSLRWCLWLFLHCSREAVSRSHVAGKAQNIYYLALYRQKGANPRSAVIYQPGMDVSEHPGGQGQHTRGHRDTDKNDRTLRWLKNT